jgi:hypothetical protein
MGQGARTRCVKTAPATNSCATWTGCDQTSDDVSRCPSAPTLLRCSRRRNCKTALHVPPQVRGRAAIAYPLTGGAVNSVVTIDKTNTRLWEISENLHRAELSVGQRADQIAEWIRLTTDQEPAQVAPVSGGRGNTGGIRAASRELGIDRDEARRAVRIASIAPEAREAAREAGLKRRPIFSRSRLGRIRARLPYLHAGIT